MATLEDVRRVLMDGWILRVPNKVSDVWSTRHGYDA